MDFFATFLDTSSVRMKSLRHVCFLLVLSPICNIKRIWGEGVFFFDREREIDRERDGQTRDRARERQREGERERGWNAGWTVGWSRFGLGPKLNLGIISSSRHALDAKSDSHNSKKFKERKSFFSLNPGHIVPQFCQEDERALLGVAVSKGFMCIPNWNETLIWGVAPVRALFILKQSSFPFVIKLLQLVFFHNQWKVIFICYSVDRWDWRASSVIPSLTTEARHANSWIWPWHFTQIPQKHELISLFGGSIAGQ